MKRFLATLTSLTCLLALVVAPGFVSAASDWQFKISAPASPLSSHNFNVQYNALSINDEDSFTVNLYQNEALVGSQNTISQANGDSGAFSLNLPDGHYNFHVVAIRAGDNDTKTADVSVDVDGTAPAAPTYLGKTRVDNSYTVKFTAPATGDVKEVRIYSSTSLSFTANSASQVGTVLVAPGQTASFNYAASSSAERFHAVRAFDAAGNGSAAVGDSQTVVTTTVVRGTAVNAPTFADGQAAGGAVTGDVSEEVQGAATTTAPQTSSTTTDKKKSADSNAKKSGNVLGDAETKDQSNNDYIWPAVIGAIVGLGLAYYWFFARTGKSLINRTPKE